MNSVRLHLFLLTKKKVTKSLFRFVFQEEIDELNRILEKQQEQHIENLQLTIKRLREEQATVCHYSFYVG